MFTMCCAAQGSEVEELPPQATPVVTPVVAVEEPKKEPEPKAAPKVVAEPPPAAPAEVPKVHEITLTKSAAKPKIGLDIKKKQNHLLIVKVKEGGLAQDHNEAASKDGRPILCSGDKIIEVNGAVAVDGKVDALLDQFTSATEMKLKIDITEREQK
eukprot:TRINITY_DN49153_c0_g1_i1.p2 TRINITY_DN49153_c0_g1~~TRINITY_DN49153_c0_g1_i1.p2  ORF type:complete len:156 (+),score=53.82 TRINITY_DN49153_c0_g1_i1:74-541(+)